MPGGPLGFMRLIRVGILQLEVQKSDEKISPIVSQNRKGKETEFSMNDDGFLYYRDRVCVPNDDELKKSILEEAHNGSFAM